MGGARCINDSLTGLRKGRCVSRNLPYSYIAAILSLSEELGLRIFAVSNSFVLENRKYDERHLRKDGAASYIIRYDRSSTSNARFPLLRDMFSSSLRLQA